MLKPKLLTTLKGYSFSQFRADAMAGIIVGIVAIPLAIAFAIASGVSPDRGLITAIIAGFIISALGGSRVQIGGPTGAFVVIVYGVLQRHGMEGLLLATAMAGVMLIVLGFMGFGSAIKFIPYPVIVGFTSGIAVIIFSSQMNDFFGLGLAKVPADFLEKWRLYSEHLGSLNFYASGLSLACLLIVIFWKKISQKIPGPLVALIASTLAVKFFHLPVETIGQRFGEIPHTLPHPALPSFNFDMIRDLVPDASTIALLAGIESLLSAVVADGMIGGKHRPNMELIAQGVANIFSPLFGGIPATGAIARTSTNVQNGGRTPVAGIVHALFVLIVMLFLGRWVALIPLSCLAAILVMVAYRMSEWESFLMLMRSPKSDVMVLLITFGLTVFVDLTVAIQVGISLSVFLFIKRMADVTNVGMITREFKDEDEGDDPQAITKRAVPEGVEVYEVNGPFFFGASYKFLEAMKVAQKKTRVRIIRMRNVPAIDATGIHTVKEEFKNAKKHGIHFLLSGVHAQPLVALERSGVLEMIGEDNLFGNIDEALERARVLMSQPGPKPTAV